MGANLVFIELELAVETTPFDFTSTIKNLTRTRKGEPLEIAIPELKFLMIDGSGSPDDLSYSDAVEALYSLSYTIKFALKKRGIGPAYQVAPLEGLYSIGHPGDFRPEDRNHLDWTLMIAQPPHVNPETVEEARVEVSAKKSLSALTSVKFESFAEGSCVQALHIGPFATEQETIHLIDEFIDQRGLIKHGRHHEIYLSDPRRTAPEKIKTILRQPVSGGT